jgi:O-antigen/teichoic acid export membrane protein
MSTIQRQSILSSIVIFAGFGFGALNLIVLQKQFLTTTQWGLTRVITEAGFLLANFSMLATNNVVAKFMPFYKRHLAPSQNDLPFVTLVIWLFGLVITLAGLLLLKPQIVQVFGHNNPLFPPYYYALVCFVACQAVFIYMEMFAWYAGKTIVANFLKEVLFRLLTTLFFLLLGWQLVSIHGFITLFGLIYLPVSAIVVWVVFKAGGYPITTRISTLTLRLKGKMISLGSFVFFTSLSNIAFIVCDTLFLASMYNLSQAGIYAVAQYFSQVLEVPMRSMQSSSVPLISEYWRQKNMSGLQSVYRKSSINLLVAGMGLGGFILVNLGNLTRYFGAEYEIMIVPLAILILARWVNLGTGLNTAIIQLGTRWRFDFLSTLTYSLLGIPLNFLLINSMGMIGAAIATLIAMVVYNSIRFVFLWKKFGLQPFTFKHLLLLAGGILLMALVWMVPQLPNLYLDGILRGGLFAALFAIFVVRAHISPEVNELFSRWKNRLLKRNG